MIILNYNVRYFLEQCILSVQIALQQLDGEIIVVDVEGEAAEAKFTFAGAAKATMPDSPEDLAEAAN